MSDRNVATGAIAIAAVILGALLLKAIFDRNAHGYRCPRCNLIIRRYANPCPRCRTELDWRGVS